MSLIEIDKFYLLGISLPFKTTNENEQSSTDCGQLWQKFEFGKFFERIPGKLSNEVLAVYHDYEGDYKDAFSYFIGCKVNGNTPVPEGMELLVVPVGAYKKIIAKGVIPDCISNTWKEIWNSDLKRDYRPDFEVYDERTRDWNKAEVDIFVSVKQRSK